MVTATWTKLAIPALPRSSHSLSVVGGKAFIWGGCVRHDHVTETLQCPRLTNTRELEPRRPVDTDMHVVDLATNAYTRLVAPGAPSARVAHTASVVGETIYIFGGRGGPAMAPIDEHGAVHVFHTGLCTWSTLTTTGPPPPPRSYHCAVGVPGGLIVHAGCAADGRLKDTWRLDLGTRAWSRLPDAPGVGRGGAALAYAAGTVWRFGGFDGRTEVGGAIDSLALDSGGGAGEWVSTTFGTTTGFARGDDGELEKNITPGPRSVAGLHGVDGRLVLMLGEGKPSPTMGHDAAGKFWSDVWVYDEGTWAQTTLRGNGPGARGWFASDITGAGVVVHGGIDGTNTRLGDGYVLRFD